MIYISNSKKIKKILLENNICNKEVINKLNKELVSEDKDFSYEITFINFKTIPSSLLKNLYKIKNKLKITTTSKTLWAYLSRLGLQNIYKDFVNNTLSLKKKDKPEAIVIGGNSQSIKKIIPIIEAIPYVNISIFIIMRISTDEEKHLCKILQDLTNYKICIAEHNMKIEKKSIYVVLQNNNMITIDGYIYLENQRKLDYNKISMNVTLKSLVYEYKESLIALLLCGYEKNKKSLLEKLKNDNFIIIVESPLECNEMEFSINDLEINKYIKILNLQQIIYYLRSSLSVNINIDDNIDEFLEDIYKVYNNDFRNYERNSLTRRIELAMQQSQISSFEKYKIAVIEDKKIFARFFRICSVNMTTFFRNPEVFKDIRHKVIPYMKNIPSIRIWCAGCSKGSEPYSITMLLDEMGLLSKSLIYATDFNENILNEAKNGLFAKSELEEIKNNYRKSGGISELNRWINEENDFIEIKDKIKDKILFFKHNLVTDNVINKFNLILCRNVLIYFNNKLQKQVFDTIDNSLKKNSFLILGESESVPKNFSYKELSNKIFKRKTYDN
ncbi:MAG: hypothetical protein L3J10_05785 [Sulfurimonas sp.]|nr:hypothetical protein [Sulfurimonas sp.]